MGVFTASHPEVDGFPRQQLRILQALCDHVAVAVHNARRFQSERAERADLDREAQEARTMQQALLPKSSPYIPGFVVSGLSVPARAVGGDWYDFIPFPDGRWGLVLADVSGKGTAAALLMSATRGVLRSLAEACCTPGEVLTRLNQLLVDDFPAGKFVTMVYAVLDPAARTVTFANAGHLRPLFIDKQGEHFLDTERGLPLGLGCGDYSETRVTLSEGSKLVFYSDGITEAENASGEEYGLCRLAATCGEGRVRRRSASWTTCAPSSTVQTCATMPAWFLWALDGSSSHPRAMFLQDASVHHDEDPSLARLFRGLLVDYIFLHPDRRDFELDRLIDHLFNKLRTAENVHDVDLLRHVEQRPIRLFAQAFLDLRIDRNDAISVGLHVGRDAVAGAQGIAGEADHGDGLGTLQ